MSFDLKLYDEKIENLFIGNKNAILSKDLEKVELIVLCKIFINNTLCTMRTSYKAKNSSQKFVMRFTVKLRCN